MTWHRGARVAVLSVLVLLVAVALSCLIFPGYEQGQARLQVASLSELWSWLVDDTMAGRNFVTLRLPRILAAILTGACLAASGCAFQATLRNPLAEPYTLGVSSGAALGAVLAIRLGASHGGIGGTTAVGLAAFAGAALAVTVVWRLARVGASLPPATLLLAGVTIAMFCGALSLLVQYTADYSQVYLMVRWMMGGLDGILLEPIATVSPVILLGIGVLLYKARELNALTTGHDAASSLGIDAMRTTTMVFFVSSLLVGSSIALTGPIGFVGLIVPHSMRALVGADHRWLLPCSALAGAAFLVVCDFLARTLLHLSELPIGVLTALLGGPFFLYLLLREKGRGGLWGG